MFVKIAPNHLGEQPALVAPAPIQYHDHHIPLERKPPDSLPWPRDIKWRRKWQRDFVAWYLGNETRFKIKLELLRRHDDYLTLAFASLSRVIIVWVTADEITVSVEWEGELWDYICDFDTSPCRVPGGYVCSECPEDKRDVYPSRASLRCAEVFEPFLNWVNQQLADSSALSVSGSANEASWVRLIPRSEEEEVEAGQSTTG